MRIAVTILTILALASGPLYGDATAQPPPTPAEEQPEVLTRGPVHEAFAEPVNLQVQAGLVAPQQPPAKIEEIPPADKPEGDQFVWVPGYWSWDGDRSGYIWVSACWRAAIRFAACGPGDQTRDGEDPQTADHRQAGQFGYAGGRPPVQAGRGASEHA